MKGTILIGKLMAGLILILGMSFGIRRAFDPSWYYGNETLAHKMHLYLPVQDSFSTIFIGSSTIFYNLDPIQFDSLMPPEWHIKSYNLAGGGSLPPETYRFVEELIERNPGKISNIILELRDIGIVSPNHRNTLRKRYWLSPYWYRLVLKSQQQSGLPRELRIRTALYTTESFMERTFNLGYFNDLYGKDQESDQISEERLSDIVANGRNGMLPVSAEKEQMRKGEFYKDTSRLMFIGNACKSFKPLPDKSLSGKAHLRELVRLMDVCTRNGIHLVFVLHPKMEKVQVTETMALATGLPENHLVNLTDPDKYPELYLAENSLNYNHFNRKGTCIFTELAARGFIEAHHEFIHQNMNAKQR